MYHFQSHNCRCRHAIWLSEKEKAEEASQKSITTYTTNRMLSSGMMKVIKEAVVNWIVKCCRPLSKANDKDFVSMMKTATGCDKCVPPRYATIVETIHHMYSEEKTKLQTRLKAVPGLSLTADFWCQ